MDMDAGQVSLVHPGTVDMVGDDGDNLDECSVKGWFKLDPSCVKRKIPRRDPWKTESDRRFEEI